MLQNILESGIEAQADSLQRLYIDRDLCPVQPAGLFDHIVIVIPQNEPAFEMRCAPKFSPDGLDIYDYGIPLRNFNTRGEY